MSKKKISERLHNLRHSAAHLLAQAVLELFPGTKTTIGPVTERGFFYDFLPPKNFTPDDLPVIEEKMREIAKKDEKIEGRQVSKQEAKKLFADNEFKLEIINDLPEDEQITVYSQGNFIDLCKGGHVASTGQIKHFKLMAVAGSYWRADKSGTPLQRISGIAFKKRASSLFKAG